MASTEEIPVVRARPSRSGSDSDDPMASNSGAALMACSTCAKKGERPTSECPYRDLIKPSADGAPPAAVDRTAPRVCPVCRCVRADPRRRRESHEIPAVRMANLPMATSETDLRILFCRFGILTRVSLSPDGDGGDGGDDKQAGSGSRARCGGVEFLCARAAQQAIGMLNGRVFGGLVIRVDWAAPYVPPPICAAAYGKPRPRSA